METAPAPEKKRSFWLRLFTDVEDSTESGYFGVFLWFVAAALGFGLCFLVYSVAGWNLPKFEDDKINLLNRSVRTFLWTIIAGSVVSRVALALATWPLVQWYHRTEDKGRFLTRMSCGLYVGFFTFAISCLFISNVIRAEGHLRLAENLELCGSLIGFQGFGVSLIVLVSVWLTKCKGSLVKSEDQAKARKAVVRLGFVVFILPVLIWFTVIGLFHLFGVSNEVLFPYR